MTPDERKSNVAILYTAPKSIKPLIDSDGVPLCIEACASYKRGTATGVPYCSAGGSPWDRLCRPAVQEMAHKLDELGLVDALQTGLDL